MYKVLLPVNKLEGTYENPHQGETLSLSPVPPGFRYVCSPEESQWQDSLLLLQVYKIFQTFTTLEDSYENPQRRETLFLRPV